MLPSPVAAAASVAARPSRRLNEHGAGAGRCESVRVLVVDDEPDFLATCVRLLSLKGHEALTATNALDAISRIDTEHPDLVVTDLRLGGPEGQVVVQHARRARPPLPVIIVSGHPSPEIARMASRAGAEFLAKPISPTQLMAAIDRIRPWPAGESA